VSARFGPFEVDSVRRLLLKDGGEVHLTPKAFDLLALLVNEAPRVVRKNELHERLWPGTFVSDATLVGLIKEVRRALDDRDPKTPLVRTAHGVGYAFASDVQRGVMPASVISRWLVVGARRLTLNDGDNVIGRDPTCTVLLDTAGISRRHARILGTPDGARLEDLNSKNGTTVNDRPVESGVALQDGDRIQVGPIVVIYHQSASGVSTETIVKRVP